MSGGRAGFHLWTAGLVVLGVGLSALSVQLYSMAWFGFQAGPQTDYFGYEVDAGTYGRALFWANGIAPGLGALGLAVLVGVLFRAAPRRVAG